MHKLFNRSLLIVFVPLLCQVIFVCALLYLLLDVQTQAAREAHSRDLLNHAYGFAMDVSASFGNAMLDRETRGSRDTEAETLKMLADNCRELAHLAKSDTNQKDLVSKFLRIASNGIVVIRTWQKDRTETGHYDSDKLDLMLFSALKDMSSLVDIAFKMDAIEQTQTAQGKGLAVLRKNVWLTFAAMVLASILATVALGIYYANGIRSPLQRLTRNSDLLSQRKPLLKSVPSEDEFGQLDRLLHVVSDSVGQALIREQEMLANAADLILSLDQKGEVQSVNPFTEQIFAMPADSIVGQSWLQFVYTEDCAAATRYLESACTHDEKTVFDLRLKGARGNIIDSRWAALWSKEQNCLFCVVQDISEQKNLERLKQDYINMVSNDLRSPLLAIHSSITLIEQGHRGPLPPGALQEVRETAKSIEFLSQLIDDLLDLQKLQSGKMHLNMSRFALQDVLRESIDMVLSLAQTKNIKIILPQRNLQVVADHSKLRQCLVNLLSNAIKFSPANAPVEIEAELIGDQLELRVIDRGPGVPEQYGQKIFDAFEQISAAEGRSREGTGLGLTICKLVAEAHGGTIGVLTPVHQSGSIFWLKIPTKQQT